MDKRINNALNNQAVVSPLDLSPKWQITTTTGTICGGSFGTDNCKPMTQTEETSAQELSDKIDKNQKDLQAKIDALADNLNLEYAEESTTDVPAHYQKKDNNSKIILPPRNGWNYMAGTGK